MTNQHSSKADSDQPTVYQIRIEGQIGSQWTATFDDMTITYEEGHTLFTGPVIDQAALHGLLRKVRDLGLTLLSVERFQPE